MGTIALLAPTNLNAEIEKFVADNSYNPQFQYPNEVPTETLHKWGEPQEKFVEWAELLIQKNTPGDYSRSVISNSIVEERCRAAISEIGIKEPITITFDEKKATRCSVSGNAIMFRDPPMFNNEEELAATINHELQTHLLRNLNQKKQGWVLDREKQDALILRTEEGLAVLNSLLEMQQKGIWRPASYYLAVSLGMKYGFAEMYAKLRERNLSEDFCIRLCIRVKRGLKDTSALGGNTKDICYLEGIAKVWTWFQESTHQLKDLYLGKVFIEELTEKKTQVKTDDVYLPTFSKNLDLYYQHLAEIGEANEMHSLQTKGLV